MSPAMHIDEANRARDAYDRQLSSLRRTVLIKGGLAIIICLMIFSHATKVRRLNELMFRFGMGLSGMEQQSTAFGFIANHLDLSADTLRPNDAARTLQSILQVSGSVLGRSISLETDGKRPVSEVLDLARQRPSGIAVSLPYIGATELPTSYWLASLISGIVLLFANTFGIGKARSLIAIRQYCMTHLHAALEGSEGASLAPDFVLPQSRQNQNAPWQWRGLLGIVTGIPFDRLTAGRRIDLLEMAVGFVSGSAILLFAYFFLYLVIESHLPLQYSYYLPQFLVPISLILALLEAIATGMVVGRFVQTD
jgi:hypothetical protein